VSGIGPKTAKLIVVSLAGKIGGLASKVPGGSDAEIVSALVGLGYQQKAADQAVSAARIELKNGSKEELLRLSLAMLGKR
jgi:Holliday junction DNA helicase RuvA